MGGGLRGIQWSEGGGGRTHTGPPVWVHIPARPLARYVALGKSLCLSVSQLEKEWS